MSRNLHELLAVLPDNLGPHMVITILSLLGGISLSLPLSVLVIRHERWRYPVLTVAGLIQTIPSLALLALMVPLLAAVNLVSSRWLHLNIPVLGFYPTVLALTLYSMLPMVRNMVTGILDVEPDLVEVARGMGMTPGQILRQVQMPLAMPVMVAGIRTAAVWTVGLATLATPVGQTCLGNYIFTGLQTRNWLSVLFGCVAAALLAILLDLLIGMLERASQTRSRRRALAAGLALLALIAAGLAAPALAHRLHHLPGPSLPPVRVGSKTFTEQYILSGLMSARLSAAGLPVRTMDSLGSTVAFDALVAGELDVYVDYSGTLWTNQMGRTGRAAPGQVMAEITRWLDRTHGILCLGSLGFENAYTLAMQRENALTKGISSIADLRGVAGSMKIGGDYEFFGRHEWRDIKQAYGLDFAAQVSFDSTFMYQAVARGDVDVISAFSSDGRIAAFDLVLLHDPAHVIPPYDAVVLLSSAARKRPAVIRALSPLIGAINISSMRRASRMVDGGENRKTVAQAVHWLDSQLH